MLTVEMLPVLVNPLVLTTVTTVEVELTTVVWPWVFILQYLPTVAEENIPVISYCPEAGTSPSYSSKESSKT